VTRAVKLGDGLLRKPAIDGIQGVVDGDVQVRTGLSPWREMDSNFWYRGTKAVDFRSIPGIAGVSAGLLNDTT